MAILEFEIQQGHRTQQLGRASSAVTISEVFRQGPGSFAHLPASTVLGFTTSLVIWLCTIYGTELSVKVVRDLERGGFFQHKMPENLFIRPYDVTLSTV